MTMTVFNSEDKSRTNKQVVDLTLDNQTRYNHTEQRLAQSCTHLLLAVTSGELEPLIHLCCDVSELPVLTRSHRAEIITTSVRTSHSSFTIIKLYFIGVLKILH